MLMFHEKREGAKARCTYLSRLGPENKKYFHNFCRTFKKKNNEI